MRERAADSTAPNPVCNPQGGNHLDNIFNRNADSIQEKLNMEELKESNLQEFKRQCKHHVKKELYLNITFAEDMAWS